MLCCNHSSFSDPIWVIVGGNFDELPRTMAKKELEKNIPLWHLYRRLGAFPVDRENRDILTYAHVFVSQFKICSIVR